jgi:hypothetical protein
MMAKPSRAAFACLGFQFPDSSEDGILRGGQVKASIRDDPQSNYFEIRRSDDVSHSARDHALDRRRLFDSQIPRRHRSVGS